MIAFVLVIFAFATLRSVVALTYEENKTQATNFIAQLLVTIPMIVGYIWLLKHFLIVR